MEKLEISGFCHRTVKHAGCAVLKITHPVLTGDTPMATHATALLATLLNFAETTYAPQAKESLFCAVKNGRLSAFSPYRVAIEATKTPQKRSILLTLTLTVTADGKRYTRRRMFYWTADEMLRKRPLLFAKKYRKARKTA